MAMLNNQDKLGELHELNGAAFNWEIIELLRDGFAKLLSGAGF